ncbi:MAG: PAS domain S-box protein [Spirochaetes bacterium]|nr:PAS domain S-box protein [Spirochaetota bacterium]
MTEKTLKALIIEDSEEDTLLLVRELRRGGYAVSYARVEDEESLRESLADGEFDVVISDHAMPRFDSLGALGVLRESRKDIPFIIVSGSIGEEVAVAAMKAGAHDYVMKDNLSRLVPAVERELIEAGIRREKRLVEERIVKSERRYRAIAEDAPLLMCRSLSDGTLTYVNNTFCSFFGKRSDALVGGDYRLLVHEEDRRSLAEAFAGVSPEEPVVRIVTRVIAAGGTIRWMRWTNRAIYHDGRIAEFQAIGDDITEEWAMAEALRESEEKFHQLFSVESDAIFLIDNDTGELLEINESAVALYGYGREELLRMKNTDLSAQPDRTRQAMADRATGIPIRYHRKKDGTVFPVEIAASHLTWKGRPVHIAAIRDITKRMRAEELLRESERKYRTLVEENPFLICTIRPDGDTLFVNRYVQEVTGYSVEEVVGADWWELFYPGKLRAQKDELFRAFETGDVRGYEMQLSCRDGGTRILQWNSFNRWDDDGLLVEINGVGMDVTERKRAEWALRQSEEKHRTLFETMAQGVVYQDADGAIVSANPAAERILGLTLDRITGRTSVDERWRAVREDGTAYPGEEHPAMRALRTGREVLDDIMGVYNPIDASYRWIIVNAIPRFHKGEDRPFQVYTTFEDITSLRETRMKLQFQLQFLNLVINAINVPIFFKDIRGVYVGCNHAFEVYLGLPLSEIIGKSVLDVAPRELAEHYHAMDNELLQKGGEQVYEARVRFADGSSHDVIFSKSVYHDERGGVGGIVGIMVDITERKRAEEAVRESERFAQSTVNALDASIAILDETGEIVSVNRAWREFALANGGDSARVSEGADYLAVCDRASGEGSEGAADFAAGIRRVMEGTLDRYEQEYTCDAPDEKRWFIGRVTPFPGAGPVRIVVAHMNITERKLAEERIRASLHEKEVLLREIHHRVKNNMQVISSLMGLQSSYIEQGADVRSAFQDMQKRIKTMAIVHEKLYQSADFGRIDFREYMASLASTVFQTFSVIPGRVSLKLDVESVVTGIDMAIPCGLIVNELVSNALKHAFPGNRKGTITVSMKKMKGGYRVSVKDNGIGLPAGFSMNTDSSLGMRLVGVLSRQINGNLKFITGKGAEFVVSFPAEGEDRNEG